MKKTAVFIAFLMLLTLLTSCGGKDPNTLNEVASFFEPPVKLIANVKGGTTTAKMEVEIFDPESEVVMRTVFTEPETLKGLIVERKKDGKLVAGYRGITTELDQNALKFIAVTHDIMREVSNNLSEYGKIVESGDERYGKAVIKVNDGEIGVYFDLKTNKPLRIDSDLFDMALKIDITNIDSGTNEGANATVSNIDVSDTQSS